MRSLPPCATPSERRFGLENRHCRASGNRLSLWVAPVPVLESHSFAPASWLIRISEVFAEHTGEIIDGLGATRAKRLGTEYHLVQVRDAAALRTSDFSKYVRWNLPVEHSWPCNPEIMDGFVEKAAQATFRKFGSLNPQAIFIGQLDPDPRNRYYKTLASNLRGRTLQLFPDEIARFKDPEVQDSSRLTLFCLVGKEGLFCGMQSPAAANGFYPGGTKFISQKSPDVISRAGAKIAEALHFLRLYRPEVKKNARWLELGACPGGMTSELLDRGYRVTAIDRAPLDKRLDGHQELNFALMDVAAFRPGKAKVFDAILSDMNGDPREAIGQVIRLAENLTFEGIVIFTLKTQGVTTCAEMNELHRFALESASAAGLHHLATTHLTYNRHEFTMFFELLPIPG